MCLKYGLLVLVTLSVANGALVLNGPDDVTSTGERLSPSLSPSATSSDVADVDSVSVQTVTLTRRVSSLTLDIPKVGRRRSR